MNITVNSRLINAGVMPEDKLGLFRLHENEYRVYIYLLSIIIIKTIYFFL